MLHEEKETTWLGSRLYLFEQLGVLLKIGERKGNLLGQVTRQWWKKTRRIHTKVG